MSMFKRLWGIWAKKANLWAQIKLKASRIQMQIIKDIACVGEGVEEGEAGREVGVLQDFLSLCAKVIQIWRQTKCYCPSQLYSNCKRNTLALWKAAIQKSRYKMSNPQRISQRSRRSKNRPPSQLRQKLIRRLARENCQISQMNATKLQLSLRALWKMEEGGGQK